MQKVKDVMTRGVRSMSPQDTVLFAAQVMEELNVGALPIVEGSRLRGVITDGDIVVRGVALELPMATTPLSEVMTEPVESVSEDEALEGVLAKMQASQIRRLPVLDQAAQLVGMVSLGDLAVRSDPEAAGFTLADISEPAPPVPTGACAAAGGAT